MTALTNALLFENERYNELLVRLKDATSEEDKSLFQTVLDTLGFWSPSEAKNGKYLTPYAFNRKSWVIAAPENWQLGDYPISGIYRFTIVWQDDEDKGEDSWHLRVIRFSLVNDYANYITDFYTDSFSKFIGNKWHANFHSGLYQSKPETEEVKQQVAGFMKMEHHIRMECLEMAPEFMHHTWPKKLQFEGAHEESAISEPTFFKKTYEMLMQIPIFSYEDEGALPFKTLDWTAHQAKLISMATYRKVDENARRMYGIEEKVDCTKEIGVWLTQTSEVIDFEVNVRTDYTRFQTFSGTLKSGVIYLEMECPDYKEDKSMLVDYLAKHGVVAMNIPTMETLRQRFS